MAHQAQEVPAGGPEPYVSFEAEGTVHEEALGHHREDWQQFDAGKQERRDREGQPFLQALKTQPTL